jgi:hypothetical protein
MAIAGAAATWWLVSRRSSAISSCRRCGRDLSGDLVLGYARDDSTGRIGPWCEQHYRELVRAIYSAR